MTYLIIIIALTSVICYARMLFKEDERMKYKDIYGDWTLFEDFYFCSNVDIILLEGFHKEKICLNINNYVPLK